MKKTSKSAPVGDPARRHAVIYARVSSKEQEKEGFSIPAQLKLLEEYAAANGFTVAQEYVDVDTAKQIGCAAFSEMVAYLKAHSSVRVMLVEKTDRLYRNLKDWVTVDELDVEMHVGQHFRLKSFRAQALIGPAPHTGRPVRESRGHAGLAAEALPYLVGAPQRPVPFALTLAGVG